MKERNEIAYKEALSKLEILKGSYSNSKGNVPFEVWAVSGIFIKAYENTIREIIDFHKWIKIGVFVPDGDMGRGYYSMIDTEISRKGSMSVDEFEEFCNTCNVTIEDGIVYGYRYND